MRDAVATGRTAESAARCVALVSTLLSFAVARGLRAVNPVRGIKKAPVRKVERFLSAVEIARLAEALAAERARSSNPYPSAAIELQPLTSCRKGEIVAV